MESVSCKLKDLLGAENVITAPEVLAQYASDKSFSHPIAPVCVVKVKSAGEVESVIKWANETKTPLVPVSSGGVHYKGDTVPSVPGAVIVDMSGMKKIISINRTHRIAIVEPGVTYEEFLKELEKEELTVSMPLCPRAEKSVLTSCLETEPRMNSLHQWCYLDPVRCLEVIWGDGRKLWTGEAGLWPQDLEAQWAMDQWQWDAVGPMMLDYYRMVTGAQGTMGIATWGSIRCELAKKASDMFIVPADSLKALEAFAYKVIKLRYSDEFFLLSRAELAYLMAKDSDEAEALKAKLPAWAAIVGVCGRDELFLPEERVAVHTADIGEIAQSFGLDIIPAIAGIKGKDILEKISKPCQGTYWKEIYKGAFQEIFFVTTLDRAYPFIDKIYELADKLGYRKDDIGIYLQPEHMGSAYRIYFTLPYCDKCAKETAVIKELFEKASAEFSNLGAYYLRPYGIWSRLQLNKDAESYQALVKLRGIFDPNGIMNPGKLTNY